jgi:hypothetical protein
MKPANKAEQPGVEQSTAEPTAAEPVERRAGTKGNADQQSTYGTQCRESVSQALGRIRKAARERKQEKFTALFHHISMDFLEDAFFELKENAVAGVDRLTWRDYEADLQRNLTDLHDQVHRGAYPIAVAALEDKIVQRAVTALLNAIYEEDFLGFSYGFRPGRGAHDAMDALCVGIHSKKVSWILDADIRSFFDAGTTELWHSVPALVRAPQSDPSADCARRSIFVAFIGLFSKIFSPLPGTLLLEFRGRSSDQIAPLQVQPSVRCATTIRLFLRQAATPSDDCASFRRCRADGFRFP